MTDTTLDIRAAGVAITPFASTEAAALARLGNDPSVARMVPSIRLPFDAAAAAARIAASRWHGRAGFRAAIRRGPAELLGEIGLGREHPPTVMLWLGSSHRRQGVGGAALDSFLDFVFDRLGPQAVAAECYLDNPASLHLLEGAGFRPVGEAVEEVPPLRPGPVRYRRYRLTRADREGRS